MIPTEIAKWIQKKGMNLVATGDWTHPLWFKEILATLEEQGNGLLKLKNNPDSPWFMLATEVSSIYKQGSKLRRVHTLIWVPSLVSADKINKEFTRQGCNLMSDGRPIIGLSCRHIAELVLTIEPKALIIPAHAWTPWFSVFGSLGGFDSLEEAFGPYVKDIHAIETGLSSNPAMNWRIKELDSRAIVSFSDAHSGPKLGREATVIDVAEISYDAVCEAIRHDGDKKSSSHIAYSIEFYPEEGKYHYTGHRTCNIRWRPDETKKNGMQCPVCGKPLTQGVMERVEQLAGRSEEDLQLKKELVSGTLIEGTFSGAFPNRPPFVMLVPLQEIISEAVGSPVGSPKVQAPYNTMTKELGGEFSLLLNARVEDIKKVAGDRIAQGIDKVRKGDIHIDPGYDGVFGVVKIWKEGEEKPLMDSSKEQLRMF
jgi:uncharacterized protein (TIGR00375 family)